VLTKEAEGKKEVVVQEGSAAVFFASTKKKGRYHAGLLADKERETVRDHAGEAVKGWENTLPSFERGKLLMGTLGRKGKKIRTPTHRLSSIPLKSREMKEEKGAASEPGKTEGRLQAPELTWDRTPRGKNKNQEVIRPLNSRPLPAYGSGKRKGSQQEGVPRQSRGG